MINIANNEIKFNDLEEKMWKKKIKIVWKRIIEIPIWFRIKLRRNRKIRKNSIIESLTGYIKQTVMDLLRNKTFNQIRIMGN